jgi:hypothetical protein
MRWRQFITFVGGAATAPILRPLSAWSQQRIAHLGVLMVVAENDPDAKRFVAALENQLDAEGWHKGHNLEIAYRIPSAWLSMQMSWCSQRQTF